MSVVGTITTQDTIHATVHASDSISATIGASATVTATADARDAISATIASRDTIHGSVRAGATMTCRVTSGLIQIGDLPYYQGSYSVTPGEEAIVLPTEAMSMSQNLVIQPVPNNYGRIAWDGATLTVY